MSATTQLLRALRDLGLTQMEISRETGIPQPRLSKWGSGAPSTADDVLKLHALHAKKAAAAKARKTRADKAEA